MKISEQVFIIINKDLLWNYIAVLHSKSYHNLSYFISPSIFKNKIIFLEHMVG